MGAVSGNVGLCVLGSGLSLGEVGVACEQSDASRAREQEGGSTSMSLGEAEVGSTA